VIDVASARVARLATAGADGRPHVVPICFVLEGHVLYTAVDQKPKRTRALRRLRNIEENPWVEVVIDHYEEDWTKLAWVRLRGRARVVELDARVLALLAEKYPQYRRARPEGPLIAIRIEARSEWRATPPG
jgi:PPOX class probable F420-dependent enzyme